MGQMSDNSLMNRIRIKSNLKELMRRSDINQLQLSKKTGVPQPTIQRILSGEVGSPSLLVLMPLCNYFGVTLDALVGWSPLPRNVGLPPPPKLTAAEKELLSIYSKAPPGLQSSIIDHARLIKELSSKSRVSKRDSK